MKLEQLNESIKQMDFDDTIHQFRNYFAMYRTELGLTSYRDFENGYCYDFAMGLYNFLKNQKEQPELIFITGNMLKNRAVIFDVDPKEVQPFHTVVKLRKHYYDINGRLGNKREIVSRWSYFRNKKMIPVSYDDVKKYSKDQNIVKKVEEIFSTNYKGLK